MSDRTRAGAVDERGQVAPLLALFAVAIGLACLGLGRFGAGAADRARAQTAADAAALAGAAGGEAEARALAAANGGAVRSFEAAAGDVRVRVDVRGATASARARAAAPGAGPGAAAGGLAPALQAALARAAQVLGEPVRVTSGYRSPADQRRLWAQRDANRFPVAPPGTSQHERGLAVDVAVAQADRLAAAAGSTGLCRPYPVADPVHFEPC
jgi:D-alanyl-D-alanine dipeptidase